MKRFAYLIVLIALGAGWSAQAQPLGYLNVPLIGQKTNVWCWAASGEMTMQYFGVTIQQCAEATFQFGQAHGVNCCPTPGAVCVSGGQVVINHYGFTYQQLVGNQALTPAQIENQIAMRHGPWIFNPYCANSGNCGSWGHVLTGVGYFAPLQGLPTTASFPNLFFLIVNDPWPPNTGSFYLEFYPSYKAGCWWGNGSCNGYAEGWDIYDIVPPKPQPAKFKFPQLAAQRMPEEEVRALLAGDPNPEKVAELSWRLVRPALTEEAAANLGFESATAAEKARIARPVEQFDISLARLRAWKPQSNVEPLLEHTPSLLVPVEADGRMRASIRLRQEEKRWHLSAIGSPQFTAAWEKARAAGGEFIVFVQGLEVAFAGKRAGGKLTLISLFNDPELRQKEGEEMPADRALAPLAKAAAGYRGNGATLANRTQR